MKKLDPAALDRCAGALLAAATGDALGAGYEFGPPPPLGSAQMVGGGLGDFAPFEWTDDTSMLVCVGEVLATGLDPSSEEALEGVAERFAAWAATGPADIGIQTSHVLRAAARSGGPRAAAMRAAAASHFASTGKGAGNGSLMRTAPVALACLGDDEAISAGARAVSDLTHGDPLAGDACVLWCVAIDRAVRHQRLDGAWDGLDLLPAVRREDWRRWLDEARTLPSESFGPRSGANNGYVVTALQAALSSVLATPVPSGDREPCEHLSDALQRAVSVGGDTDTVATIAGMLLGARWGATAVPFALRRGLHGYPGLRGRDLVTLGVTVARRGASDPSGWPSSTDLMDHYRSFWPAPAFLAELPGDDRVLLGNVHTLAGRPPGVDAVVSLCRIGADQVTGPDHHEVWLVDVSDPEVNPNLVFVLRDAAAALETLRSEGRTVLLHCVAGASRTPTVAAAYLARKEGLGADEALGRVCSVLPGTELKPGLVSALDRAVRS